MKPTILFLLFATATNLSAQSIGESKTLFGSGIRHMDYFVSPSCQVGRIAGSDAVLPGLGVGVIINGNMSIGVNYRFIATENTPVGEPDGRLYLDQQYAGIRSEYFLSPGAIVHMGLRLEAGVGHTELDLKDPYEERGDPWEERGDPYQEPGYDVPQGDASFAYLEPGIALEINVSRYLKLDVGAGYRFVGPMTFRSLSERDLRGVNYSAAFKVGVF
jgi:hypothetical protein